MGNYLNGRTLRERIFSRLVAGPNGCIVWTGSVSPGGYGRVSLGRRTPGYVHRGVYLMEVGPIPTGMELDHLCRNRRCANPHHLEAVAHGVNIQRSWVTRKAAAR